MVMTETGVLGSDSRNRGEVCIAAIMQTSSLVLLRKMMSNRRDAPCLIPGLAAEDECVSLTSSRSVV